MNINNFKQAERVYDKIQEYKAIQSAVTGTFYLKYKADGDLLLTKSPENGEDLPFIVTRVNTFITGLQTGIQNKITALEAEFAAIL